MFSYAFLERNFQEMNQSHLDDMAERLCEGSMTRAEFRSMCTWLIGMLAVRDWKRDLTLEVLWTLTGRVTYHQRQLLRCALTTYSMSIDQVAPDSRLSEIASSLGVSQFQGLGDDDVVFTDFSITPV